MAYQCDHRDDPDAEEQIVPATWYITEQCESQRKGLKHGQTVIEHEVFGRGYACCDEHLARAVRYFMDGFENRVLRVRRVNV